MQAVTIQLESFRGAWLRQSLAETLRAARCLSGWAWRSGRLVYRVAGAWIHSCWKPAAAQRLVAVLTMGPAVGASGLGQVRIDEAEQLPAEIQWSRATETLAAAVRRADHAIALQGAAVEQVEAAMYALQSLRAALNPVLNLSSRDEASAVIHEVGLTTRAGLCARENRAAA